MAVFGGKPGEDVQFKGTCILQGSAESPIACTILTMPFILGMAGNQVLEWADLDTEIKTANLKDVSLSFCP